MLEIECKKCNKNFFSKNQKKYCSFDCYIQSDDWLNQAKQNAQNARNRTEIRCQHCQNTIEVPKSQGKRRKFCSKTCFRQYMAKRFDRWIANPESLALPQCYDEFLAKNILRCPIKGCHWTGKFLGLHVNLQHGLTAERFKEMAGFNKSTGLISLDLFTEFSQRSKNLDHSKLNRTPQNTYRQGKAASLETKEHYRKNMADRWANRPIFNKKCDICQNILETKLERTKYCLDCRKKRSQRFRQDRLKKSLHLIECLICKKQVNTNHGTKKFCSNQCRKKFHRQNTNG